jgi:predicted DNA-binding protein (UPF0251 family)
MKGVPEAERFEAQFTPEPNSGCWLWTGAANSRGYGYIMARGIRGMAHRFALERATGVRPSSNVYACHKCDTPSCVNPDHLFWGSQAENMSDMVRKGRKKGLVGDANPMRYDPTIPARGERNGNVKLTDADVAAIRLGHQAGEGLKSLAAKYGVNRSHIWRITSGRNRAA